MKKILYFIFLTTITCFASAQTSTKIQLPEIGYLKNELFEISNYVPTPEFLAINPNFLINGTFELNSSLIPEFNTKKVQRKLNNIFTHQIGVKKETSGMTTILFDEKVNLDSILNISSNHLQIFNSPENNKLAFLNGDIQFSVQVDKSYANLQEFHKFDINKEDILTITNKYGINDFDLYNNNVEYSEHVPWQFRKINQLILHLRPIKVVPLSTDLFGNSYPSYAIYRFSIYDASINLLKSYDQIIFFSCKYRFSTYYDDNTNSYATDAKAKLTYRLYKIALRNAIGQMANDEEIISQIKKNQQLLLQRIQQIPEYLNYLNAKKFLKSLQSHKVHYLSNIKWVNDDLQALNAPQLLDVGKINLASFNNLNANAKEAVGTLGNIAAAGFDALMVGIQKSKIEALRKKGLDYVEKYNSFQIKEDSLINAQPHIVLLMLQDDNLLEKDPGLAAAFQQAEINLTASENKASGDLTAAKQSYLTQLSNALVMPETMASSVGTNNIYNTSGNNNNSASGHSECENQATAAWKSSQEYITYHNTLRVADVEYCKAKMAELTLQYCSSQLTPQQIVAISKFAKDTRANGDILNRTHGWALDKKGFSIR